MTKRSSRPLVRWLGTGLLATIAAFCLLPLVTISAFASTINIYDDAGVLNQSQVRNAASAISYPMSIYTVTNFTGSNSAFDQRTASKITGGSLIVMAINTTPGHGHVRVDGGQSVPLSNSQYQDAANAFASSYRSNHDYTSATLAAISSLQRSLAVSTGRSGSAGPAPGGIGFFGSGALCCVGLLVLAAIGFFVFIRRRPRPGAGGFFNRGRNVPPYDPNYNQPYNQGYPPNYPPNYGPGYPGYNQNQGMNPWAAGGLGAAAGGFVGYELGKREGEEEARDRGYQGDQGNFGGGGDFGGGGGADFDNGGGNFGGGGDFGNGGGSDFDNGGGNFGGGGGSDF
jgi:uncharacterized membrane protein YgcG